MGVSEKLKIWGGGGEYDPGAGLLKKGGGETFPVSFFQDLSFLHLEVTLPFERKLLFSATIIL